MRSLALVVGFGLLGSGLAAEIESAIVAPKEANAKEVDCRFLDCATCNTNPDCELCALREVTKDNTTIVVPGGLECVPHDTCNWSQGLWFGTLPELFENTTSHTEFEVEGTTECAKIGVPGVSWLDSKAQCLSYAQLPQNSTRKMKGWCEYEARDEASDVNTTGGFCSDKCMHSLWDTRSAVKITKATFSGAAQLSALAAPMLAVLTAALFSA